MPKLTPALALSLALSVSVLSSFAADDGFIDAESSVIDSIRYQQSDAAMTVRFPDGGETTYLDVPEKVYKEFMSSRTKGGFFLGRIDGQFPTGTVKLAPAPVEPEGEGVEGEAGTEAVPAESAPAEAVTEVVPAEPAPTEAAPEATPDETMPVEAAPTEVAPEATPAETMPVEPAPAEIVAPVSVKLRVGRARLSDSATKSILRQSRNSSDDDPNAPVPMYGDGAPLGMAAPVVRQEEPEYDAEQSESNMGFPIRFRAADETPATPVDDSEVNDEVEMTDMTAEDVVEVAELPDDEPEVMVEPEVVPNPADDAMDALDDLVGASDEMPAAIEDPAEEPAPEVMPGETDPLEELEDLLEAAEPEAETAPAVESPVGKDPMAELEDFMETPEPVVEPGAATLEEVPDDPFADFEDLIEAEEAETEPPVEPVDELASMLEDMGENVEETAPTPTVAPTPVEDALPIFVEEKTPAEPAALESDEEGDAEFDRLMNDLGSNEVEAPTTTDGAAVKPASAAPEDDAGFLDELLTDLE